MSVLAEETIRSINELFKEAQGLFDSSDYIHAYEKFDSIKRRIQRIQVAAVAKTTNTVTIGFVVVGLVVPGVGNMLGATIGACVGRELGKYLGQQGFRANGTIEEITELACAGKQECKSAQREKHLYGTSSEPAVSLYAKWLQIRKEVLGI